MKPLLASFQYARVPWQECSKAPGNRNFGNRHFVGGVSWSDISDVCNARLSELEHVGSFPKLLRGIMFELDGVVGPLLDLFHPRLEHQLYEIVALRKGVSDTQ